jgi:hypothetical protein
MGIRTVDIKGKGVIREDKENEDLQGSRRKR